MNGVKTAIADLAGRHDALSRRERIMVFAAALAVIYGLWDAGFQQPAAAERTRMSKALADARTRLQVLDAEAVAIKARAAADPNAALRGRIAQLGAERRQLEQRQNRLAHLFLPPHEMAPLLERLLEKEGGLRLLSLATQPPLPLTGAASTDTAAEGDKHGATSGRALAYRHGLVLELEGGYFDLLRYLRALEAQPIFWQAVDFRVKEYPVARVRLEVFTLSFQAELLSV